MGQGTCPENAGKSWIVGQLDSWIGKDKTWEKPNSSHFHFLLVPAPQGAAWGSVPFPI